MEEFYFPFYEIFKRYRKTTNDFYEKIIILLYIFGDGENDIEMLKYATHSYTPKNVMECTKKVVNNICYSCQEDGVAQVIAQLLR